MSEHTAPDMPYRSARFDRELRYVEVERDFAYSGGPHASIGKTLREVSPEVADQIEVQIQLVLDTGSPIFHGLAYTRTPNNPHAHRLYQHDMSAVLSKSGKVVAVTVLARDITINKLVDDLMGAREEAEILSMRAAAEFRRSGEAVPRWVRKGMK